MKNFTFLLLALFCYSLNAQISTVGLLAYYPFDGDVLDYGPNSYHGTMYGGNYSEDSDGNILSALHLDGTDDFVDLSAFGAIFRENLSQMTIIYKIRYEDQDDDQTILSLGNDGEDLQTNVFEVEFENSRLQIETETGSSAINHEYEIDQSGQIFTDEWQLITITIDGDSLSYCKDGQLIYQDTFSPTESFSNDLFLGCFAGTNFNNSCCFFGGFIDGLQFYDRILDKDEISVSTSNLTFQQNVELFPNPTSDNIFVKLNNQHKSILIILTNVQGKTILTKKLYDVNDFNLEIPDQKGIYFLQLIDQKNNTIARKIIKI
jgi:Concanavalin A-like lectin/glucanases superfamily/Secretion system C-terminal sorting domain